MQKKDGQGEIEIQISKERNPYKGKRRHKRERKSDFLKERLKKRECKKKKEERRKKEK